MLERRSQSRTHLNVVGKISIEEHQSLPCIVFDRSTAGVRVTLPDAELVPNFFVLTIVLTGEVLVCSAAWRRGDEIGCTTSPPTSGRAVRSRRLRQPISV